MAVQIQLRRGTASEWSTANPTLAVGEMGVETDTRQFKIGDGSTAWNSLAYGGLGLSLSTVTTQSGTTYTLQKTDAGTLISFTNSSAVTLTVPASSSVAWSVGEGLVILQSGAGSVTVSGAVGVTINGVGLSRTRTQYSTISLIYLGSDVWILSGDVAVYS